MSPHRGSRGVAASALILVAAALALAACKETLDKLPTRPDSAPPATTPLPPPTTQRAIGAQAPILSVRTVPEPASGSAPFEVNFNACKTTDPDGDPLQFTYTFGDGQVKTQSLCRHHHTYGPGSYNAQVCVTDGLAANTVCRSFSIQAF